MIVYRRLDDADARAAIADREFPADVRNRSEYVAIIPTQSWCSQWIVMQRWLSAEPADTPLDVAVYYYEYDRSHLFDDFRQFKETIWKNAEIPYIRYYHHGELITTSNFCSREMFFALFGHEERA